MGLANIAATNMEHLCKDPLHGYSQGERWGAAARGVCKVSADGHVSEFYAGDRDCSSAVIDAWQEALRGTNWEGALDGATYTGNMRSVFVGSGLFEWKPMSFTARRGDIYLNEVHHTAMCVDDGTGPYGYDALAEFSISETGGIYGKPGDQTGRESSIHAYRTYSKGWDGILHYNGKADGDSGAQSGGTAKDLPMPRYRSAIMRNGVKRWLGWCEGLRCVDGCGDDFSGIKGEPIVDIEFAEGTLGPGGWFKKHMKDGRLVGLTVYYKTPNPGSTGCYDAKYRVHWTGARPSWGKWEYDDTDDYAGNLRDAIDMVQVTLERE